MNISMRYNHSIISATTTNEYQYALQSVNYTVSAKKMNIGMRTTSS